MIKFDKAAFNKQIAAMKKDFEEKRKSVDDETVQAVIDSCAEVERTAKLLMTNATTNPAVTYGKKGHHPSVPGSAPAPDSGTLRRSVTSSVEISEGLVTGRVGSTIQNPPYGAYLENGTSRMLPRPWLRPALDQSMDYIKARFKQVPRA
jgi:HK97 gp10 family phage protein